MSDDAGPALKHATTRELFDELGCRFRNYVIAYAVESRGTGDAGFELNWWKDGPIWEVQGHLTYLHNQIRIAMQAAVSGATRPEAHDDEEGDGVPHD